MTQGEMQIGNISRKMNKEANVCTVTITKFDVVRNMLKSAIEYKFTRRSITITGKTINNV
jgi:hypothetical protein